MPRFRDLTTQSIEKLKPYIEYWSLNRIDLDSSINEKLLVETTAFNMYVAEYAINYAVLLDDKDLAEDLCKNGATLDVIDSFHDDKTPLELAAHYGRASIMEILVKYGASVPNTLNIAVGSLFSSPSTFFWALKEGLNGREANYSATQKIVKSATAKRESMWV